MYSDTKSVVKKRSERVTDVYMNWWQVREMYKKQAHPSTADGNWQGECTHRWRGQQGTGKKGYKDEFSGGTVDETLDWLRAGYRAPEFANSANYVPMADQIRAVWSEDDGEVDIGKLQAGDDDFFLTMDKRPTRAGVTIQITFNFVYYTKASVIQQYGAWCAGLISRLEADGFDLEIGLLFPADSLVGKGKNRPPRTNIHVRVKDFSIRSDFNEWSVIFAPTGYRHLGFTAYGLGCDALEGHVNWGICRCPENYWGVAYDKELSLVTISCDSRGSAFDPEHMTQLARDAGILPKVDHHA